MWVFLDLQDDLVREMRRVAAREGQNLSELAEECLRRGFDPALLSPSSAAPELAASWSAHDADPGALTLPQALVLAKIH
jgi:hypothetical protein